MVAEAPPRSGLRQLVQRLDDHSRVRAEYPAIAQLDVLRRESETLHARSRLRIALQQAPAEGGPLNSAVLVHRMLETMQALSPAYLQHFIAYADALSWLEQVPGQDARAPAPARPRTPRPRGGAAGGATPASGRRAR